LTFHPRGIGCVDGVVADVAVEVGVAGGKALGVLREPPANVGGVISARGVGIVEAGLVIEAIAGVTIGPATDNQLSAIRLP
jgi:hypothetical protein